MTEKEPLTPAAFDEEWIVTTGSEKFSLNRDQLHVLKEASKKGHRGLIWFDDFAISVPHIQAVYLAKRRPKYRLPAGEMRQALPPEEISKKVKELKEKLK